MRGMSASLYHANYDDLRALLRAVRVKAGLTQVQMADALGWGSPMFRSLSEARTSWTFFCMRGGVKLAAQNRG